VKNVAGGGKTMINRMVTPIIVDELLSLLTLDPMQNLEYLAQVMVNLTDSFDCFIVSGSVVMLSLRGVEELPESGLFEIPLTSQDSAPNFIYLQRFDMQKENVADDFVLPNTEIFTCLLSLIQSNIESCKILISASTDKLTRVLNRKYLDMAIDRAFEKAKKAGTALSVVICDLDFFKHVNDTYGHLVGDEVLRGTSKVIRGNIRSKNILRKISGNEATAFSDQDTIGRYGGEEFVVLLENADVARAQVIAERIRKDVEEARLLGDKREVTLSLGVASFPTHANTRKTLVEKADKALYMAKKMGRNICMVWDESFSDEVVTKDIMSEVITGDVVKDAGRMMVLFDILNIASENLPLAERLDKAFEVILSETGTENATLLLYNADECVETFISTRKGRKTTYNDDVINAVVRTKKPIFAVDWDNEFRDESGMTDWKSLAVVPVIKNDILRGVLYLSVSVKKTEFADDEIGFICNAAMLLGAYL
jgi:GGDEF domain-containing protein